jgi:hypothetical protein
MRNTYKILIEIPEGKRAFVGPRNGGGIILDSTFVARCGLDAPGSE